MNISESNEEILPLLKEKVKQSCSQTSTIIFCLLGFFGSFNLTCLKTNLSVTIVAMVKDFPNENNIIYSDCPSPYQNSSIKLTKQGDFYWTSEVQGHILAAFFYGYCFTHFPAGIIAEKYGGKWIYGQGVFLTAFLTLLTPFAAKFSAVALIILRVLEGCAEGVTSPSMHYLIATRVSKYHRTMATSFIYSGGLVGVVVSLSISGILCDAEFLGGWPAVFYIFGCLGCVWSILWFLLITNEESPSKLPNSFGTVEPQKYSSVPWISIVKSRQVWILIFVHFGQGWGALLLLTELPTYMSTVLYFDIKQNAFLSAIPYLFQTVTGWICACIVDYMLRNAYVQLNFIRKTCNTIGYMGTALCLIGVVQVGCDHTISVLLFIFGMSLNGFVNSGFFVSIIDMAPDFAGILLGITSTFASIPGFLTPLIVGYITKHEQTIDRWSIIIYSTAGLYIVTNFIYVIFGSAELQPWGMAKPEISKNSIEADQFVTVNSEDKTKVYP
ncbi:sialin-like [Centruroides vittatus]|uniref:sialin-like n=1 Tax=Centruroides vittatus TaxID=120091 RepID=UPI00350EA30D